MWLEQGWKGARPEDGGGEKMDASLEMFPDGYLTELGDQQCALRPLDQLCSREQVPRK